MCSGPYFCNWRQGTSVLRNCPISGCNILRTCMGGAMHTPNSLEKCCVADIPTSTSPAIVQWYPTASPVVPNFYNCIAPLNTGSCQHNYRLFFFFFTLQRRREK